ncbi:MAG: winged helix-turn-helix domain-containing protein [Chloroflexi bacterium]|nr:winged helix-turn-helix domain-containing protein [Chloroflexota bacterium]
MTTERGLILVLTERDDNWAGSALEALHEVVKISDFQQTVKMLNNVRCDLLIIDNSTLGEWTDDALRVLKHSFPHFPIAIQADVIDDDDYEQLARAGADLLLSPILSTEELQQQVRMLLYRNMQRRALITQSQRLYIISALPLMLRNISDTQEVMFQAVKVVINLFDLQAAMVVTDDGYGYRAHTGRRPLLHADQLAQSPIEVDEDGSPIFWAIRHRLTVVINDCAMHPGLAMPEGVETHSAAIIVPFSFPGSEIGAMVFFLGPGIPLVNEEVTIFERFVSQVEALMLRVHQNYLQGRQLLLNSRLVDGWRTFAETQAFDEVIRQLCQQIGSTSTVREVLVSCRDPQTLAEFSVDNADDRLVQAFQTPEAQHVIDRIYANQMVNRPSGSITSKELMSPDAEHLQELVDSNRFILIPIEVSGEQLGVVLATFVEGYGADALDIYLLENLTKVAINALQRIALRNLVLRNHTELMSIVCSITEGVFYVDENQRVTFYNPQLIELTHIEPADWINQDVSTLLRAIAGGSHSPVQTMNQLQVAMQRVIENRLEHDYPIVTIPLAARNVELSVEFVSIDNATDRPSWLGIVHPVEQSQGTLMLERALERVRVSHSQLHGAITTLAENHGHFSYGERNELLSQIKVDAGNASKLWNQFADLYRLYLGGMALRRESVTIETLLGQMLNDSRLTNGGTQLKIQAPTRSAVVYVDEFHFPRALADLLAYMVENTPHQTPVEVRVEVQMRDVHILIGGGVPTKPFSDLEDVLTNFTFHSTGTVETLNLYIATELIRRNGTQIAIQPLGGDSKVLRIVIPISAHSAVQSAAAQNGVATPRLQSPEAAESLPTILEVANSAPAREPNAIMIVEGKSKLIGQLSAQLEVGGFSLIAYDSGDEALRDVNSTYLDVIIIDLRLEDENGLDVCKRVRGRVETPIVLVADSATPQEKVNGLQAGADDFITAPITDEELLARVRVIVNRRYIAARTSEPILFGDLYVDFARRAVFYQNTPIELTRIEYDILYTLIVNRGQTVTHKQLLTQVWGPEYQDESQYLWVNISRLRKKLEARQDSPRYIRTQSGVGYYFAVPE